MNTQTELNGAPPAPNAPNVPQAEDSVLIAIQVNGALQHTSARTLAQWLQEQGAAPAGLATAVNGQFVPRAQRAQQALQDGDAIVTFQPIEGG